MSKKRRKKIHLLPWVGDQDWHLCGLPCPAVSPSTASQVPKGLHHVLCTGNPSLIGATCYWLGADPCGNSFFFHLPTAPKGSAILIPAKGVSSPVGSSSRGLQGSVMVELHGLASFLKVNTAHKAPQGHDLRSPGVFQWLLPDTCSIPYHLISENPRRNGVS